MVFLTGIAGTLLRSLISKRGLYVICTLLATASSGWLGYSYASAGYEKELRGYEKRIADISIAIKESQDEAINRHNQELEARRNAFLRTQKENATLAAKVKRLANETSSSNVDWDLRQRMRLEELYSIYGYAQDGESSSN